jgi:hypothetical protein
MCGHFPVVKCNGIYMFEDNVGGSDEGIVKMSSTHQM